MRVMNSLHSSRSVIMSPNSSWHSQVSLYKCSDLVQPTIMLLLLVAAGMVAGIYKLAIFG